MSDKIIPFVPEYGRGLVVFFMDNNGIKSGNIIGVTCFCDFMKGHEHTLYVYMIDVTENNVESQHQRKGTELFLNEGDVLKDLARRIEENNGK